MYIYTMNNAQHNTTMNTATTTTDFNATLTAKFYAVELTFERDIFGETHRSENIRLEYKGRTAFPGGRAKDYAKQWRAQAIAKGIRIESIKFVAI